MNYYNENDKYASQWLKNLVREKLIPEGEVDDRSIEDVEPKDLKGFNQCHFFAGIGGWAYALQLAGWDASRPVWTGSCPCQSFSVAGQRKGASDERHLWPAWFRLIRESKPATVFGEQVVGAIGFGWLDAVATDLEACDYRFASAVLSGYVAGAYHRRQRLWFVADSSNYGRSKSQSDTQSRGTKRSEEEGRLFESKGKRSHMADTVNEGLQGGLPRRSNEEWTDLNGYIGHNSSVDWKAVEWVECGDGKTRPIPLEPDVQPLVNGVPEVMDSEGNPRKYSYAGALKGIGNAIIPQVAAVFISSFLDTE